jgi:ribose 5-phosphate isomerase B
MYAHEFLVHFVEKIKKKKHMIFSKIALGSDHAGFLLRREIEDYLSWSHIPFQTFGATSQEAFDYPLAIPLVVQEVLSGAGGILICGSGIGMSIGANRYKGIRAALCSQSEIARLSRAHNDANLLVLGSRFISFDEAKVCIDIFLTTPFEGGRHSKRVDLLDSLPC